MSELDCAMMKHISYIVLKEHRPFSYRDFLQFELDRKQYKMQHGTFRNKISGLIHAQKVELAYNSGIAFYSMKGLPLESPRL
jgi:hypothetical protein